MKANSLEDIFEVLENPHPENTIELASDVQQKALQCLERMFEYAES